MEKGEIEIWRCHYKYFYILYPRGSEGVYPLKPLQVNKYIFLYRQNYTPGIAIRQCRKMYILRHTKDPYKIRLKRHKKSPYKWAFCLLADNVWLFRCYVYCLIRYRLLQDCLQRICFFLLFTFLFLFICKAIHGVCDDMHCFKQ